MLVILAIKDSDNWYIDMFTVQKCTLILRQEVCRSCVLIAIKVLMVNISFTSNAFNNYVKCYKFLYS